MANPAYREVALTIDDGPDPRYGPQIIALLHQRHIAATFFLVGIRVKQHPEIARLLARDGFEIGNHTYDHQRLPALKPHEIANELRLCDAAHLRRDRPAHDPDAPAGRPVRRQDAPRRQSARLRHRFLDRRRRAITTRSRPPGSPGASWTAPNLVRSSCCTRTTPTTLAALPLILDGLQAQGYKFVTVSQMLAHLGVHSSRSLDK